MSLTTCHKLRVRVGKRFNLSSLLVKKNVKKARKELNGAATIFMIKLELNKILKQLSFLYFY